MTIIWLIGLYILYCIGSNICFSIKNWFIVKALGIFKMKDKKEETDLEKTFDEICKSRNCSTIAKKEKTLKKNSYSILSNFYINFNSLFYNKYIHNTNFVLFSVVGGAELFVLQKVMRSCFNCLHHKS